MTSRQAALLHYHLDTARLLTGLNEVFWVLDLEDPVAFAMACALEKKGTDLEALARVTDARDTINSTDCVPSQTATMPLATAQICLAHGWNITTPLPPGRYMAVVSGGRLIFAVIPAFTEETKEERNQHGNRQTQTNGNN